MFKRVAALCLCVVMLVSGLTLITSCSNHDDDDIGPYITMYLSDEIYDFDPARAFNNTDAFNVVSLLFDTLFTLNSDGEIEASLVDEYEIDKENHTMELKLKQTYWSNGTPVSADDVVYAWKRLLNVNNSFEAASLLFDIKNARAVKSGNESLDNLGVEATKTDLVTVTFEGEIDYDRFLLNLTNVSTAPLPETYVEKDEDWAKKSSTMISSGPYRLGKVNYVNMTDASGKNLRVTDDYWLDKDGKVRTGADGKNFASPSNLKVINYFYLERNTYYYRDLDDIKKSTDKNKGIAESVYAYRILVDCSKSDEEILQDYKDGKIFYVGSVPLSIRNDSYVKDHVQTSSALSTFVCAMNENAVIGGVRLFAIPEVRKALSLCLDRDALANAVVYADAATALVPPAVFNFGAESESFRSVGGDILSSSPDFKEAEKLLQQAGIEADAYSFTVKVAGYDDVHILLTEMIADAWNLLGFHVTVEKIYPIQNNDVLKSLAGGGSDKDKPTDVCDDLITEAIRRVNYEVIAYDSVAYSADAASMLAPFAKSFSGMAIDMESGNYEMVPCRVGYDSEKYNALMEAIYYLPYFNTLDRDNSWDFLGIYTVTNGSKVDVAASKANFQAAYDSVVGIYREYGISPSSKPEKWAEQKAQLLHEAEKILMNDLPVIPIVFNKNAILQREELTETEATYYLPATFTKVELEDYQSYTYTNAKGDAVSIFVDFPIIRWDLMGKDLSD